MGLSHSKVGVSHSTVGVSHSKVGSRFSVSLTLFSFQFSECAFSFSILCCLVFIVISSMRPYDFFNQFRIRIVYLVSDEQSFKNLERKKKLELSLDNYPRVKNMPKCT